ncbi:hypothetical protein [Streptomyces katrae]|uniref:hypothetical protein n=1 Tax=Streptomyces katrae TaxID=68223 RepID=UPI0004BE5E99|nr:hypothetical protein [Streptomyces katrae]
MPVMPAPMRTARAAMFAAVCTALGAVGHSYMSGTDIPLMGLLGAFGVTGGLAWLAAGRRRGPVGISAALLAVQGVLHLVFSGSQAGHGGHTGHAGYAGRTARSLPLPLSMPEPMPGHHRLAGTALPETAAGATGTDGMAGMADMSGMAGTADMAGHGGLGMIAAHVLAGLFCAAWLAWGEAAVCRLAAVLGSAALLAARPLARAVALLRARVAPVPPRPAAGPSYEPPRRLRGAVPAHALVRRGPPGWRDTRATAPGRPACA